MASRPPDPKSGASANSATFASRKTFPFKSLAYTLVRTLEARSLPWYYPFMDARVGLVSQAQCVESESQFVLTLFGAE